MAENNNVEARRARLNVDEFKQGRMKMKLINVRTMASVSILCALLLGLALSVGAQVNRRGGRQGAALTATMIDPEKKAQQKAATVEVQVTDLRLVDPAKTGEQPKAGQDHLHYQVDDGPVIATTTTKLSFHGLTPGEHKIVVMLAANDHSPLGPQQTLTVTIP
ncbi:MAG: DUF6130 family protein [Acidobacteria bacterium]|nr:DUF6130 family protein [Acidobacteriota bacterium]